MGGNATNGSLSILFGEIEGGAGRSAILARFLRTTQKATQTNCSLCASNTRQCSLRSYVARYRVFLRFLLPSVRPRAGHRVDGRGPRGGTTRGRGPGGRERGDIYAGFLLRFSPREQNGNNMSPGRESKLVALGLGGGRKGEGKGGGCANFL